MTETKVVNTYHCEACNATWEDVHTCACDDKCPTCNRSISPERTDNLHPVAVIGGTMGLAAILAMRKVRQ